MNPELAEIDAKLRAGSYKPALAGVVASLRAGRHPSSLEFGALLYENGCDQAEARSFMSSYVGAIAGGATAEDTLMAQLRGFNLPRD